MKRTGCVAGFVGVLSILQAAPGQVVVTKPGISVFPFAGTAAGQAPLTTPQFGFIDLPGGHHHGDMIISESVGNDLARIDSTGRVSPYTAPYGLFPGAAYGLDVDGPIANMPLPTPGSFGGPLISYAAQRPPLTWQTKIMAVYPGGFWAPAIGIPIAVPGIAQLQFDRTQGFMYGGLMYGADWGGDASDGIIRISPSDSGVLWAPLPSLDPRYFTFDLLTGFGPNKMWVSSYATGAVFSIDRLGVPDPPIAVLGPGAAGLAFSQGGSYFETFGLYVCNLVRGGIDVITPDGVVKPFARGLPSSAYPMFVMDGPFAHNGQMTLYVADGVDSVWMFVHCLADLNDDSVVDFADYLAFLNLYNAGDPKVDYTGDRLVDFGDYLQFLNYYDAGC